MTNPRGSTDFYQDLVTDGLEWPAYILPWVGECPLHSKSGLKLTELIARTYVHKVLGTAPHLSPKLLDEFERQATSCSLIPIDSGAKEHQVWAQKGFDHRQGDGGCLVNHNQLSLTELSSMLRLDVLHSLHRTQEHVKA